MPYQVSAVIVVDCDTWGVVVGRWAIIWISLFYICPRLAVAVKTAVPNSVSGFMPTAVRANSKVDVVVTVDNRLEVTVVLTSAVTTV